ncbi:MAG: ankyrin repeat domain-containing protein [Verrucomicrobia bacterium]|nr:ankyrin repeat domain-containing protein [Verrucomicrobiota bacterium]
MARIPGNTDFEFELAVKAGNTKRIRTLVRHKARPPTLLMLYALLNNHPELLPILKEAGCDPNDKDGFSMTALGCAMDRYPIALVEQLLDLGADPNQEATQLLPLVTAADDGELELLEVLLKAGADPNKAQWNGLRPIQSAAMLGYPKALRRLIEAGADPLLSGPAGKDVFYFAAQSKNPEVMAILEPYQAKVAKPKKRPSSKRAAPKTQKRKAK